MAAKILAAALLLAVPALGRTDLEGCTTYDSVIKPDGYGPYLTRIWYVPDTGELCDFLDCGGGRAPPKTTVPGCPSYEGTETYSPSFIDLKTLGMPTATGSAEADEEESATETITEAPSATGSETGAQEETTLITSSVESEAEESSAAEEEEATTVEEKETTTAQDKDSKATITSVVSMATSAAGSDSASGSASGSDETADQTDAAATPAGTVSTAGAAAMPTAGALLGSCLMAGAAVYAGML
ncbi:hypothetical protein FZEAL_3810 [Fusarium zealandicum]|uniref:Siderophore biosynthesis enzyme n=1 Tax=Fusarium zealandicum TaxID=1053134 RepID=A0A8H4XLF0_9HYPO|nr:hypothetical protein FZEAL_3810 [Fusarium zealandicum]